MGGRIGKYLCLVLLIIACHKEERTTVTFWHVMSGPLGKQLDDMIEEFNHAHPDGIVVSSHMGSYDVLAQKLMGAVASHSPPVIAQMYESWTDQFFSAGILQSMEDYVKRDSSFHLEDFFPVFIEDNTYDSVLVTLPFNKSVPVFYYNRDLFDSCGIAEFPRDWRSFREACRRIRAHGVWPTSWPVDVWYFSTMLYQEGGDLYDVATRTPQFNDQHGTRVLEYVLSLVRDSLLYVNPGFQRQVEFIAGNVAMIPASVVSWAFLKGKHDFTMKVVPFPQGREEAVVIAGTNIGMFKSANAAQKELAWTFIKWFLTPENQVRWTKASFYLPTRQTTTRLPEFQDFCEENKGYREIVAQLYVARTEPRAKEWFAGRIYLIDALEEVIRLERTPQEALDYAAERLTLDGE